MRKTLATLLSIAMVLSFVAGMFTFSLTSTAATTDAEYAPAESVYVNGATLDASNTSVACGTGTASFDAATGTLTLNNATVDDYVYAETGALTVVLTGDNVINGFKSGDKFSLRGKEGLTIKGTGTLDIPNGSLYVIGAICGDLNILGSVSITVAGPEDLIHMGTNAGPDGRKDANITIGEDAEVTLVAEKTRAIRTQQNQGGAVIIKDNAHVDILVTNASDWGVGIQANSDLRILDNCEVNITMNTSNQSVVGINQTSDFAPDNALWESQGDAIFAGGTLNININNTVASDPRSYCYLAKGVQKILFGGTDVTVNINNTATSSAKETAYFVQQNNDGNKVSVFGVSGKAGVHSANWAMTGGSITVAEGSADYIPLFLQGVGGGNGQGNSRLNISGGTIRGKVSYFNRYRGITALLGGDIDVTCTVGVTGTADITAANFDYMTHAEGSAFATDSTLLKCSGVAPIFLGANAATTKIDNGQTVTCGSGTASWDGVNRVLTLNNATIDTGIYSLVGYTLNVQGTNTVGDGSKSNVITFQGQSSASAVYDQDRDFLASLVVGGNGTLNVNGTDYVVFNERGNMLFKDSVKINITASGDNTLHIGAGGRNGTLMLADSAKLTTGGTGRARIYIPGVAPAVKITDNAELVANNTDVGVMLLVNNLRFGKEAPTAVFEVSGNGKYTSTAKSGVYVTTSYSAANAVRPYASAQITLKDNAEVSLATTSHALQSLTSRTILTVQDQATLNVNKSNASGDAICLEARDILYGSGRGGNSIIIKDDAQVTTVGGNCGIRNSWGSAFDGAAAPSNQDFLISVSGNALLDVSGVNGQAVVMNDNTTGSTATFEVKDAATASAVHPNKNWAYGIALQMAAPTVNFNVSTTETVTLTGYQTSWNGALYLNGVTVNALVENATLNITNTLPSDITEANDNDVSVGIHVGRGGTGSGTFVIGKDAKVTVNGIQNSPTKAFRAHGIYLDAGVAMTVKENAQLNVTTSGSCATPSGFSNGPLALQSGASATFGGTSVTNLTAQDLSSSAIYGENAASSSTVTVKDDATLNCTGGRLATIQTLREQGSGKELTFNVEGGSVILDNSYDGNPAINPNVIVDTSKALEMTIEAGYDDSYQEEVTAVTDESYVKFTGWSFGTVQTAEDDSVASGEQPAFEIAGAQIRTSNPTGLRFVARISQRVIDHYAAQGEVKYGILVQRKAYLDKMVTLNMITENTLTMANTKEGKTIGNGYAVAVEGEYTFESHDGYVYYTALITGMPSACNGEDMVARAYIQVGDQVIYATEAEGTTYAVEGAYAYAGGYCVSATNVAKAVADELSDEMKALYGVE